MLSQDWTGPRDFRPSRAARPMRYSTTRQQADHPLRAVCALIYEALRLVSTLERLYSTTGRPSIPAEQLLGIPVPGPLQGPQRTAPGGGTGLRPAVSMVRRVEYGGPGQGPDDVGSLCVERSR